MNPMIREYMYMLRCMIQMCEMLHNHDKHIENYDYTDTVTHEII